MAVPPHASRIACDLAVFAEADAATLDALARLQLAAARLGVELRLHPVERELLELAAFAGLDGALRLEPCGEPEEREDPLGVEEERQLGDPPV
jgi:ABC-type transporter Mla MlaB component